MGWDAKRVNEGNIMKLMSIAFLMLLVASTQLFARGPVFDGQYDVPVQDEELVPFAKFPLTGIDFDNEGFEYHIPTNLAETGGLEIEFNKTGVNGDVTEYISDYGVAKCQFLDQPITRCDIDYNKKFQDIIAPVTEEVRQRLIDQGFQGEVLAKRMRVVDGFSGDPIGILFVHRPNNSGY